ncbi:hypothetical protein TRVL_04583 [Trypanosoma vivax]|nr:hypothetical protein TRVL_04583 [Trypanosoma vivax]
MKVAFWSIGVLCINKWPPRRVEFFDEGAVALLVFPYTPRGPRYEGTALSCTLLDPGNMGEQALDGQRGKFCVHMQALCYYSSLCLLLYGGRSSVAVPCIRASLSSHLSLSLYIYSSFYVTTQ